MPFQSEKQRRYLWANEPKISRDWTEKYGSRVKKETGGILNTNDPMFSGLGQLDNALSFASPFATYFSGGNWAPRTKGMDANLQSIIANQGTQSGTIGYSDYDKSQVAGASMPNLTSTFKDVFTGKLSPQEFANMTQLGRLNYDINPNGSVNWGSNKYNFRPEVAEDTGIFSKWANRTNRAINPDIKMEAETIDGANYIRMSEAKKEEDALKQRISRQGLRYPQSQDLEAQASGMFEEEDEDGNFIDRMRKYTIPAYNFMRGKVGAGLMGLINLPAGLAMFSGGRKNSNAYRGATGSAGGYNAAQLNQMNALGGYYSEPARDARRTQSRIDNMMARKAAGKSYSQKNLANLSTQISGDRGNNNAGISSSPSNSPGHPSNRARGGRMAQGGLASLWQR